MTTVSDTLTKITDRLQASATTKTVYGDPLSVDGRTLIPVARVRYGFGAGGGNGGGDNGSEGSGGGGGVEVLNWPKSSKWWESRYISLDGPRVFIKYALIAMGIIALVMGLRKLRR